jgi:hypothetical protein
LLIGQEVVTAGGKAVAWSLAGFLGTTKLRRKSLSDIAGMNIACKVGTIWGPPWRKLEN